MQELKTKQFLPLSAYKVKETSKNYFVWVKGGKKVVLPKIIVLDEDVSWLIGVWIGDNFGSRYGTKIAKCGVGTSGRFGLINNDLDIIKKFTKVCKKIGIANLKVEVQVPIHFKGELSRVVSISKNFKIYKGSSWRREPGVIVYTNNTSLLRVFTEIYKNPFSYKLYLPAIIAGLVDSEGNVDKANKEVKITTKDLHILNLAEHFLHRLKLRYVVYKDIYGRTSIKIKDVKQFYRLIKLVSKRKQKLLDELIAGNLARKVDKAYLTSFRTEPVHSATIKSLSVKFGIPIPTVKLVLRNLYSSGMVKRRKEGKKYIYSL